MRVRFASRSPWSNEYDPPLDDGTVPSVKLRKLEISANEAFDTYRAMCVPSVYYLTNASSPANGDPQVL